MKNYIKETFSLFIFNAKPMIIYGIIYTVLTYFIFNAIQNGSIVLAMDFADIYYLGDNTILKFLSNPITWLILIFSALLLTFLCLISTSSIIYAFNASRLNKKVTVKEMFGVGLYNAKRVFEKKNFALIPYLLIFVPFVGSIELGSATLSIDIPGFILDAIFANKALTILFIVFIFFIVCFAIEWFLSIPIFIIEECDFIDACKKSSRLMKKNKLRFLVYYALVELFLAFLVFANCFAIYYICLRVPEGINRPFIIKLGIIAFVVLISIILFAFKYIHAGHIVEAYFYVMKENGEELNNEIKVHKLSKVSQVVAVIALITSIIFLFVNRDYTVRFANTHQIMPSIAAHRGDSVRAPENSMPAFELAIEENIASWIELDVHQTKDGVIIVSHDDYLGAIGIDRYVHDSTYEELIKYDSGAYFSDAYKGLHLCTLKEALELAKDKIAVQIEIKPTEYDDHIEEAVIDIIKEVNSSFPIAVLSLKDKPIKRIKEIDPNITTIYCTIIASDGIEYLDYADWYSIEESSISEELVSRIHQQGKKCFVWTINKKDNVQFLVDCGVDVILTDDPIMMQEALRECDYFNSLLNATEQVAYKMVTRLKNIID